MSKGSFENRYNNDRQTAAFSNIVSASSETNTNIVYRANPITRKPPKPKVIHSSYYLKESTVINIDKHYKELNMTKSELVDTILENFFMNFKVD